MTNGAQRTGGQGWSGWRVAGWSLAALVLLLPLAAMRFTDEVNWTGFDFLFAAVMIGGVGLLFELAVRSSSNLAYRAGVALALAAGFLTVWVNGAVGMIGDEDNPYNLLFGAVLFVALLGSASARFRPAGMALATAAAGFVQIGIALGGVAADPRGALFSIVLAAPWLLAAASFRAARGTSLTWGR